MAKNPTCEIVINGTPVFSATSYEYLGVILDSSLSLQLQLTKIYKKASARLRLLHRIRSNVSPAVAESIYFSMILPILLYCYPIYCNISATSNAKLQSLHNRAGRIVNSSNVSKWESLITVRKRRVCVDVFKSLNSIGPEIQLNKFEKFDHSKDTREYNSLLKVPKVKTESGRNMFRFQGALIFNTLHESNKNEIGLANFKHKVKLFNFWVIDGFSFRFFGTAGFYTLKFYCNTEAWGRVLVWHVARVFDLTYVFTSLCERTLNSYLLDFSEACYSYWSLFLKMFAFYVTIILI